MARRRTTGRRGQVLVAILNSARDLGILREHLWYRIPVDSAPRPWPPRWLAFYQTRVFGDDAYTIRYFGSVLDIEVVPRYQLFPHEPPNTKSDREYYRIRLRQLEELPRPLRSARPRRLVFVPTTWALLSQAESLNDLFTESPLEDRLWARLRALKIDIERQWELVTQRACYHLDFAVFCVRGNLDIETDGDSYHLDREHGPRDNERNNAVEGAGFSVLRFGSAAIREGLETECLPQITRLINRLGGSPQGESLPRVYYDTPEGLAQQLSLFEAAPPYPDLD